MEESDNMLITTLREYIALPEHIVSLKDVKGEEIFTLSLAILEYLKVDVNEVKVLSGKAQRFRAMAKLSQNLYQQLQTQFELNQLMNPSIPFLRKYFLALINKLGSGQNVQKGKGKKQAGGKRQEKRQLKAWLNLEWIHPSLAVKHQKYKGYILPLTINKNLLKNNINLSSELNNQFLSNNVQSILNSTVAKHNQRVKQFEANEGISRREGEEAAMRLQNIVKANKDDWQIKENKLQKLKKKIIEAEDETSAISAPQVVSVFKQQLQDAEIEAEKKKTNQTVLPSNKQTKSETPDAVKSMTPLQLMKQEAEKKREQRELQIRAILNELKQRKDAIQQWERQKNAIQSKMATDQQKIARMKQETMELKKKVEKRQVILSSLQGENNVEQDVKKLQGEINLIDNQVKEEVNKIEGEIKGMKVESKEKMEALTDIKTKLNKVQNDYERVCQEIVEKEEMKGGVKIMKSGISRLYYHKKISEMESRWRDTAKQTKKLKANLEELRQKTRISGTLNLRMETEIQNILNMDKSKNEPQSKQLRELMAKCKTTFQTTLQTLEEANEIKLQTQDYEMKVHGLSGKNYKQNIDKIGFAMEDLKKEIAEISKSKLK